MSTYSHQKKFGQNFLHSSEIIKKITHSADLTKKDTVVEIGPGRGALTFDISARAGRVFAIEKDHVLAKLLREKIERSGAENITVVQGDIRDVSVSLLTKPLGGSYSVIGNIPYYITANMFRKFLEEEAHKPEKIIFMVQKEVAERIVSREPKHSLLSVSIAVYGTAHILFTVSRNCFSPSPNVDSAVISVSGISLDNFRKHRVSEKDFFRVLRGGFLHPRKVLINTISGSQNISKEKCLKIFNMCGIQKKARAGELSVPQWFQLTKKINQEQQL